MSEMRADGKEASFVEGRRLAQKLRTLFDLDFAAVSVAPFDRSRTYAWQCVSGNTSTRYQRIFLPEGVGALGLVATSKRPLIVNDAKRDIVRESWYQFPIVAAEGLGSFFAFPLLDGESLAFIVLCAFRHAHQVEDELFRRAQVFALEQTGCDISHMPPITLHPDSATPQYAETTHRIIQAQEDERRRIARELHDGLAQELLLVQIELRHAKYLPLEEQGDIIERASVQLRDVLAHVSSIASNLRPAALDELGLAAVVSAKCKQLERVFGICIDARVADIPNLNPDCEVALYRIFQEASSNSCKYSLSDELCVTLGKDARGIRLEVQDFGCGFDVEHPAVQGGGLGLAGMRERAASFGGTVAIDSKPGQGTKVSVLIPTDGREASGGEG